MKNKANIGKNIVSLTNLNAIVLPNLKPYLIITRVTYATRITVNIFLDEHMHWFRSTYLIHHNSNSGMTNGSTRKAKACKRGYSNKKLIKEQPVSQDPFPLIFCHVSRHIITKLTKCQIPNGINCNNE